MILVKYPNLADQIIQLSEDGTTFEYEPELNYQEESSKKQQQKKKPSSMHDVSPEKGPKETNTTISQSQNPIAFTLEARYETAAADPRDYRRGELGAYNYYFTSLGYMKLSLTIFLVLLYIFFKSFTRQSFQHFPVCEWINMTDVLCFPEIWLEWWTASNVDHPNNRLGYWIGVFAVFGVLSILSLILACWYVR